MSQLFYLRYLFLTNIKRLFLYYGQTDSLNEECVVSGQKTQFTSIAMTDSVLLYISPRDYLQIFDLQISKFNFIAEVLLKTFGKSQADTIRRLSYKFKEEIFAYDSIIFNQDDSSNMLMIIRSGLVEISQIVEPENRLATDPRPKKNQLHKMQLKEESESLFRTKKGQECSKEDQDTLEEYEKYYGKIRENVQEEDSSENKNDVEEIRIKKKKNQHIKCRMQESVCTPLRFKSSGQLIKLGIVGSGEMLGLDDYVKHQSRSYTAKSISADTLVYFVSRVMVEDIIEMNDDFGLSRSMKEAGRAMNRWHFDHLVNIQRVYHQEQHQEVATSVMAVKKRFSQDEEVNFKTVVQQLFKDKRFQIVQDSLHREANSCSHKITRSRQNSQESKQQLYTDIGEPQSCKQHPKINIVSWLNRDSFTPPNNQMKWKRKIDESENQIKKIDQQEKTGSSNNLKLNLLRPDEMGIEKEYVDRFCTKMDLSHRASLDDLPVSSGEQIYCKQPLPKIIIQDKKSNLLRNYPLETVSLSQKQRMIYKIQNNLALASRFKKYDAQSSKAFLEAKRHVKLLRQSQVSKSHQQGNILQGQREERLSLINSLQQQIKTDEGPSCNNSILQMVNDKQLLFIPSSLKQNLQESLNQMNELTSSNIVNQEVESKISSLPFIINTIQPGNFEMDTPFKRIIKHERLKYQKQCSNENIASDCKINLSFSKEIENPSSRLPSNIHIISENHTLIEKDHSTADYSAISLANILHSKHRSLHEKESCSKDATPHLQSLDSITSSNILKSCLSIDKDSFRGEQSNRNSPGVKESNGNSSKTIRIPISQNRQDDPLKKQIFPSQRQIKSGSEEQNGSLRQLDLPKSGISHTNHNLCLMSSHQLPKINGSKQLIEENINLHLALKSKQKNVNGHQASLVDPILDIYRVNQIHSNIRQSIDQKVLPNRMKKVSSEGNIHIERIKKLQCPLIGDQSSSQHNNSILSPHQSFSVKMSCQNINSKFSQKIFPHNMVSYSDKKGDFTTGKSDSTPFSIDKLEATNDLKLRIHQKLQKQSNHLQNQNIIESVTNQPFLKSHQNDLSAIFPNSEIQIALTNNSHSILKDKQPIHYQKSVGQLSLKNICFPQ